MKTIQTVSIGLLMAMVLASTPLAAAKPDNPGGGKGGKPAQVGESHRGQEHRDDHRATLRFNDKDRSLIRDYYRKQFGSGNCPPGLAKKRNGCLPPGQTKQWSIGHRLPPDLVFYDLPGDLLRELGRAPEGHKYVRVAADILLIAIGTSMVVDAIEDLSNL